MRLPSGAAVACSHCLPGLGLAVAFAAWPLAAGDPALRRNGPPAPAGPRPAEPRPPAESLVRFVAPWTSPFRVDPRHPHHLVNADGRHLLILNKTAWAYFGCKDPTGVLGRAKAQGVTVLRVALEGRPYFDHLGIELWPWGGTRERPDWARFNGDYWDEVERRVRLAGEHGIGLVVVLYMAVQPADDRVEEQRPYRAEALRRLGRYANVLTWEVCNETLRGEKFQDAAGRFFAEHDAARRPVCTSDGTTDDAAWPHKPWVGLAINHSCTSSTDRHGLRDGHRQAVRRVRGGGPVQAGRV